MSDCFDPVAQLETLVVAHLQKAFAVPGRLHPQYDVRAWPDPKSWRMTHPNGAVLLIYTGGKFDQGGLNAGQSVHGEMEYELGLMARTLRGAADNSGGGIYGLLQGCRSALLGYKPDMATSAVRLRSEDFGGYEEGVWRYSLRFVVPVVLVGLK